MPNWMDRLTSEVSKTVQKSKKRKATFTLGWMAQRISTPAQLVIAEDVQAGLITMMNQGLIRIDPDMLLMGFAKDVELVR